MQQTNPKIASRVKRLEQILATVLMLLPLILILVTGEVRTSISDYAYSSADNLFSGLLWLSAGMFSYNAMYSKKTYNFVLAIALIGVSLTDHLDHTFMHYLFAVIFFIGSIAIMISFSSAKQRLFKIYAGLFIVIALLGGIVFNWYSLLIAEWICMLPICIHFIGESLNKID